MSLELLEASPFTTTQDLGRFGYQRFGVPTSGAMDPFAFRAANELVGNNHNAAALEIGFTGMTATALEPCLLAVTGVGVDLIINNRQMNLWTAIYVRKGWEIEIAKGIGGCWAYLAIAGGIRTPNMLGSRSTYLRGNFGRALQAGDIIEIESSSQSAVELAGRYLSIEARPQYDEHPTLEVIMSQTDRFTEDGVKTFLSSEYKVSRNSDRMGYRLEGARIAHRASADIISDGMALGAIQIPANGQPILMMADHATAGGYPKIAAVVSADIPIAAQCLSVEGEAASLRFKETTVEAAQARYRTMMRNLKTGIVETERYDEYAG